MTGLGLWARGRRRRDRRDALLVGLAVILAIALGVGATVAAQTLNGGPGGEVINGTPDADVIHGGTGDDLVHGLAGNDQIFGQAGADDLYGDEGNDVIDGGSGDDRLLGGAGDDTLTGGPGRDEFNMADGELLDDQAAGNDIIYANDGEPDAINCGAGEDTAYVDRNEEGIYDCEHVIAPPSTPAGGV